jgi:hypothetical protein
MQSGKLFYSGGHSAGPMMNANLLDVTTNAVSPVGGLYDWGQRNEATTVLLPPAQLQQVMIIGGAHYSGSSGTANVEIAWLNADPPAYHKAPPLHYARTIASSVVLPDRTVLVAGGGARREADPVLDAELYDPVARTWTIAARAAVPRMYHSTALLLPDGRVLMAGNQSGGDERRLELYSPPYLFKGPRPVIDSAPEDVLYATSFDIGTPDPLGVKWVSLVRPMAVTHGTDSEQRLVNLPIASRTATTVRVTIPAVHNLTPPGWYMLVINDAQRVPSVARWVHLQ